MSSNAEITWKKIYMNRDGYLDKEQPEFPEISDQHFNIVNEKDIQDLSNIIYSNAKSKKTTFSLQGNQSKVEKDQLEQNQSIFANKSNDLMKLLDSCKHNLDKANEARKQEQQCIYYNLEDVEYQEKTTLSEAFSFLRDLEKQQKIKPQKQKLNDCIEQEDSQKIEEETAAQQDEEEFDIQSFKPTYVQSTKSNRQLKVKQTRIDAEEENISVQKRIKNLSLEDDLYV